MKRRSNHVVAYVLLILVGLLITFPFIWMVFACFKTNAEILGSTALLPSSWSFNAFKDGWKGVGQITFATYFINTFVMVLPTVALTVLSCSFVAFGFARFRFPGKNLFFALMISTLMLPNSVIIIPRYLIFNKMGILNTYWPFYLPAMFGCFPFFIFMIVQFLRGIPRELDEAAYIDGCSALGLYGQILVPLIKPALLGQCPKGSKQLMAGGGVIVTALGPIFDFMRWFPASFASQSCLSYGKQSQPFGGGFPAPVPAHK